MRTITEITADKNMMEAALQNPNITPESKATFESQLARYNDELAQAEIYWADQANRVQAQTEAVNAIQLPLDFNDLFDNAAANDMIIEVVKEFQTQAYADHNTEVAKINADWTSKLQAQSETAANQFTQLQARLDSEILQAQEDAKAFAGLEQQVAQLKNEKQDAEQKRDAAAAEIIRLNSHIDDLQLQLANAPAPKAAIEIGSTDRLNELAAKAKESNADKMARAQARWNEAHPELAVEIPELTQIPEEPPVTPNDFRQASETTEPSNVVQSGTDAAEQTSGDNAEPAVQTESAVTRAEIDAITSRLSAVEAHLNIPAAA